MTILRGVVLMLLSLTFLGEAGAIVTKKEPLREAAVLETSLGTIEIELYRADAPKTVENFVRLAGKRFFDGLRFHRVAKGFVIQTGDPLSRDLKSMAKWGTGGRSFYGKEFEDELNPAASSYKRGYVRGVVAMANHGRNTNSSQFFIMLVDAPQMPKNYTIFGGVLKGMEIVDRIGAVELDPPYASDGRPKQDVVLKKVIIRKSVPAKKVH
jgi:cyclophilin family peptidyl-prolyl cis-trans isomerase